MLCLKLDILKHVEVSLSVISNNALILFKPPSHDPCDWSNISWCLALQLVLSPFYDSSHDTRNSFYPSPQIKRFSILSGKKVSLVAFLSVPNTSKWRLKKDPPMKASWSLKRHHEDGSVAFTFYHYSLILFLDY